MSIMQLPSSVFAKLQVEYEDYSSGQTMHALAEAPNEALPQICRPNFGAVWLAKDKFKVKICVVGKILLRLVVVEILAQI